MVSENEGTASPDPAAAVAQMPFAAALGVVLDAAAADEVRGRLAWAPQRCTTAGIMHGGALMGLADTLGGLCAFLNLPPGAGTATISSSTVFTRAVREGEVSAVSPAAARRPDHHRGADRPGRRRRAAGGAGHAGTGGTRRRQWKLGRRGR